MEISFPIYIRDRNDFAFGEVPDDLTVWRWYEEIDILDNVYEGWDSSGHHVILQWNRSIGAPEPVLDKVNDLDRFEVAVNEFERIFKLEEFVRPPRHYKTPEYIRNRFDEIRARQTTD